MMVLSYDDTFATSNVDSTKNDCDSRPMYGVAFGCPHAGEVQINLEDTGFYIPDTVMSWLHICEIHFFLSPNVFLSENKQTKALKWNRHIFEFTDRNTFGLRKEMNFTNM